MARLPVVGGDDGNWGTLLNEFLNVAHNANGTLKAPLFNVKDYGAIGNGVNDDTTSFQSAINAAVAARGCLLIPDGTYVITSTLNIWDTAPGATQTYMDIWALGDNGLINWGGGNNTYIFRCKGWKYSTIKGVKINTYDGANNVTAWYLEDPAEYPSTSGLVFTDCMIGFNGTSTNCKGWIGGIVSQAGGRDVSNILFENCTVNAADNTLGNIGYYAGHANSLGWSWLSCYSRNLGKLYSSELNAGGAMSFFNMVTSQNALEFDFSPNTGGGIAIYGGRFETGKRFLNNQLPVVSTLTSWLVSGTTISNYSPVDGILFAIGSYDTLYLQGCNIYNLLGANYTSAMITATGAAGTGTITVTGGAIQASDTFFTKGSASMKVIVDHVVKTNNLAENTGLHVATHNKGTGSITSGQTSVVISHGLSITPTASQISITLTANPTSNPGLVWIDTITSSQFTVHCQNDPGASGLSFGWQAGE